MFNPPAHEGALLPTDDSFIRWSERLQSSDQRAFSELFEAMHVALLRYAWRFTGDQEAARDIVQDAFLKLWLIRTDVDPKRSLKALLYTMVRNLALNHKRAAQHTNGAFPEHDLYDPAPAADQQDRGNGYLQNYLTGENLPSLKEQIAKKYLPVIKKKSTQFFIARQWDPRSAEQEEELLDTGGVNGLVFSSFRNDNPDSISRGNWRV